jgi:hypothetical protein
VTSKRVVLRTLLLNNSQEKEKQRELQGRQRQKERDCYRKKTSQGWRPKDLQSKHNKRLIYLLLQFVDVGPYTSKRHDFRFKEGEEGHIYKVETSKQTVLVVTEAAVCA